MLVSNQHDSGLLVGGGDNPDDSFEVSDLESVDSVNRELDELIESYNPNGAGSVNKRHIDQRINQPK